MIKAYKYRFKHFKFLYQASNPDQKERIENYFSVFSLLNDSELKTFDFGEKDLIKPKELTNHINIKKEYRSELLYVGPSTNFEKIFELKYDLLIINKPIELSDLDIRQSRVALILNNQWAIQKKNQIISWHEKYYKVKIFSPIKIGVKNENNNIFSTLKKYPLRVGPMGLGRSLAILKQYYTFQNIKMLGFDFSLGDNPYKSWYPSLIKKNYGDFNKGLILSNMYHDFLFNYLFIKTLVLQSNKKISGSIDNYVNMNVNQIIKRFELRMKN